MKKILLTFALAFAGTGAGAADWAGGYAGVNLTFGEATLEATGAAAPYGLAGEIAKADDTTLALRAGYDWQNANLVYGLGASVNLGMSDASPSAAYSDALADAGVAATEEIGREKTIYARAGVAQGDLLVYGLAGWTWAQARGTATDGVSVASYDESVDGLSLGLGAEYRIGQNVTVFGEYLQTSYDHVGGESIGNAFELEGSKISAGLNYRF